MSDNVKLLPADLLTRAREMRHESASTEAKLWKCLRNRQLGGFKFRRQHPLSRYIADFYCHEKKIVIELDGFVHSGKVNEEYDQARTNDLEELGIRVIRFLNSEVEKNIELVLRRIEEITKGDF